MTPTTVDAHVHLRSADTVGYPLRPSGVGSPWWHAPVPVGDLLVAMDAAGVARAVVVQGVGAYGYDNSYALDVARAHADRLAALPATDAATMVATLTTRPEVCGIRCFLVGGVGADVVGAALDRARSVVLTGYLPQIIGVIDLIEDHPEAPVILDHCGFPTWTDLATPADVATHPDQALADHALADHALADHALADHALADHALADRARRVWPDLARLADLAHVSVKFSGHCAHEAPDPVTALDAILALFGPERVIVGSDFPQTSPDYLDTWRRLRAIVGGRRGAGDILGANAARLWFDDR